MKTSLRLIAILAVLASVGGSSAVAMQGQQRQVTYFYDDENHSHMVGGTLVYCNGSFSHWGSYTLYTEEYYYDCW